MYLLVRNLDFFFPLLFQIEFFQLLQFLQIEVGAVYVLLVSGVHVQHSYEEDDDEGDRWLSHAVVVAAEAAA